MEKPAPRIVTLVPPTSAPVRGYAAARGSTLTICSVLVNRGLPQSSDEQTSTVTEVASSSTESSRQRSVHGSELLAAAKIAPSARQKKDGSNAHELDDTLTGAEEAPASATVRASERSPGR